jgi:hypothetical protein
MDDVVDATIREQGYDFSGVLDAADRDSLFQRAAINNILSDPLAFMMRIPAKAFYYLRDEVSGWLLLEPTPIRTIGMVVSQAVYMVIMALFFVGLFNYRSRLFSSLAFTGLLIIVYFGMLAVVFFGASRFRLPSMPFIIMFSSFGIITIYEKLKFHIERSSSETTSPQT